jgi:hypothetical protein
MSGWASQFRPGFKQFIPQHALAVWERQLREDKNYISYFTGLSQGAVAHVDELAKQI